MRAVPAVLVLALLCACEGPQGPLYLRSGPTKTITHALGTLDVPVDPQRIVILSATTEDSALALGLLPVGVNGVPYGRGRRGPAPHLADRLGDTPLVNAHFMNIRMESILPLRPDLILGAEGHAIKYDALSRMAPTALYRSFHYPDSWDEALRDLAQVTGRTAQAEEVLREYRDLVTKTRQAIGTPGSVVFVQATPKTIRLTGKSDHGMGQLLYGDLGLPAGPGVPSGRTAALSLEMLPTLNPDHIILDLPPAASGDASGLEDLSVWKNLKAVREGRVYPRRHWSSMASGPFGRSMILHDLAHTLAR